MHDLHLSRFILIDLQQITAKATSTKSKAPASEKAKAAPKKASATKATTTKAAAASSSIQSKKRKVEDDDTDDEPSKKKTKTAATKKNPPAKKITTAKKGVAAKRAASSTTTTKAPAARKIASAKKPTASKGGSKSSSATTSITKKAAGAAKRKASEAADEEPVSKRGGKNMPARVMKKATSAKRAPKKAVAAKKRAAPVNVAAPKAKKFGPVLNIVPTSILDIYVFGEGSSGELGLGAMSYQGKKPIDVKRPRLNHLLAAEDVGVVAVGVGGMHCAVITRDNRILTWGVNDDGALGRETEAGKMVDMKPDGEASDSDSEDEDSGLNPSESEPREVDISHIPEGTKFAKIVACDSATFVVTEEGLVYGWGSFRVSPILLDANKVTNNVKDGDGLLGFRGVKDKQLRPMLIPELKGVVDLAAGTNHVLALTSKGKVFAWGSGESNQLARRVVKRTAHGALIPREFGLRGVTTAIGCGDYHSFAVNKDGTVRAWGLNSYGECLIPKDGPGDNDIITAPTKVVKLKGYNITQIAGGSHHTIALTEEGKVLTWGRMDSEEGGLLPSEYPEGSLYYDESGRARMAVEAVQVPSKFTPSY